MSMCVSVFPGQQLWVVKEEGRSDWRSSLDPLDSKPPHMKEEEKPAVKSEKEENPKFSDCSCMKTEDRRREPLTPNLAKQMEAEPDGEDCGRPEPGPSPNSSYQESEMAIHRTGKRSKHYSRFKAQTGAGCDVSKHSNARQNFTWLTNETKNNLLRSL